MHKEDMKGAAWELGCYENSATPFPEAKRIQGFKLGRRREWAPGIFVTATDDY